MVNVLTNYYISSFYKIATYFITCFNDLLLQLQRQQMGNSFSCLNLFKRLHTFQTGDKQGQYVSESSHKMMVMFFVDLIF
jgi:hypothetical protein